MIPGPSHVWPGRAGAAMSPSAGTGSDMKTRSAPLRMGCCNLGAPAGMRVPHSASGTVTGIMLRLSLSLWLVQTA